MVKEICGENSKILFFKSQQHHTHSYPWGWDCHNVTVFELLSLGVHPKRYFDT